MTLKHNKTLLGDNYQWKYINYDIGRVIEDIAWSIGVEERKIAEAQAKIAAYKDISQAIKNNIEKINVGE